MSPDSARPETIADTRTNLVGLSRADLAATLAAFGEKPFRAKQVWHWIYHRGATDFAAMTDLSKDLRTRMEDHFVVGRPAIARELGAAPQPLRRELPPHRGAL